MRAFFSAIASIAATVDAGTMMMHINAAEWNYTWSVTQWSAGCATGSCSYDFNISADPWIGAMPIPAFSAHCSGSGEGSPYKRCDMTDGGTGRSVKAKLQAVNATGTGAHLAASLMFQDPRNAGTFWNYTAYAVQPYNQLNTTSQSFSMTPTEVFGVA